MKAVGVNLFIILLNAAGILNAIPTDRTPASSLPSTSEHHVSPSSSHSDPPNCVYLSRSQLLELTKLQEQCSTSSGHSSKSGSSASSSSSTRRLPGSARLQQQPQEVIWANAVLDRITRTIKQPEVAVLCA